MKSIGVVYHSGYGHATSKRWFNQDWKDRIASGLTQSAQINGDKHFTLHYFMTLAMQRWMLWVGTGLMPSGTRAARRDDIGYRGSFGGPMVQSLSDAGTDEAPPTGDIGTVSAFGVRVETIVHDLLR
ncbi:MAG: hypothetical protein WBM67_08590 [Sedimenticolaceae bacterium]